MVPMLLLTSVTATSAPFFGIYTKPQGDGQDQTWFRSRVNYNDVAALSQHSDPAQDGSNTGLGRYLVHTGNIDPGIIAAIEPERPLTVSVLTVLPPLVCKVLTKRSTLSL